MEAVLWLRINQRERRRQRERGRKRKNHHINLNLVESRLFLRRKNNCTIIILLMDFLRYFYLLASTWPWIFGQHLLVQTDDDVVSNGLHLIWCTITTGIIIHSTCSGQS